MVDYYTEFSLFFRLCTGILHVQATRINEAMLTVTEVGFFETKEGR